MRRRIGVRGAVRLDEAPGALEILILLDFLIDAGMVLAPWPARGLEGRTASCASAAWTIATARSVTVHADGSITFAGVRYSTARELPAACVAFRPDLESEARWRAAYRTSTGGPWSGRRSGRRW